MLICGPMNPRLGCRLSLPLDPPAGCRNSGAGYPVTMITGSGLNRLYWLKIYHGTFPAQRFRCRKPDRRQPGFVLRRKMASQNQGETKSRRDSHRARGALPCRVRDLTGCTRCAGLSPGGLCDFEIDKVDRTQGTRITIRCWRLGRCRNRQCSGNAARHWTPGRPIVGRGARG